MSGTAFYNEVDPYAASWLRNLIDAGHIAHGVVDERSIVDLDPDELRGYTQCHFFAGIGVWSHALRLAGWPDDRPVWTGSCPCQPFSAAGKGKGHEDERHLWPAWQRLISECRPATVFGEQVAGADGLGWLDVVLSDLEDDHYAVAAADLPAAGVGAPHIRQRLYFVADADEAGQREQRGRRLLDSERSACGHDVDGRGALCLVGYAERDGLRSSGRAAADEPYESGYWALCDWIACRDGKARPVESRAQPLADGIAARMGYVRSCQGWTLFPLQHGAENRVGRLRAYGNAIVAPVAAAFITAAMETTDAAVE